MWKQFRVPEFALGVLAACAIFGMGMLYSTHPPIYEAAQQASSEQSNNESAKIAVDERIANYTWWLAILTGVLAAVSIFQGGMLLRAEKTSRISADAASLNARAAVALELPVFAVRIDGFSYGQSLRENGSKDQYCLIHRLVFKNLGRTKAFPLELKCGWAIGENLPNAPEYTLRKPFLPGYIIEADPNITPAMTITEFPFDHPLVTYESIRAKTVNLWFYCELVYLDFMQERRTSRFCWLRYETFGKGGFLPEAAHAYNQKT